MEFVNVLLVLTEEMLGSCSGNPKIHEEFISAHAPDAESREDEIASLGAEEVIDKQKTVFYRTKDGRPCLKDYQIRGMFKDSCGLLRRSGAPHSKAMTSYKKIIDGSIFVFPRDVVIWAAGEEGDCQRPLRASGPQGERVALANSETVPAGSVMAFTVRLDGSGLKPTLEEWLEYLQVHGVGQWRNSGKGTALYAIIDDDGKWLSGTLPKKAYNENYAKFAKVCDKAREYAEHQERRLAELPVPEVE